MKNAVRTWIHSVKDIEFKKADEPFGCSDRTWQFIQNCIITLKNKYNFWAFYQLINMLSLVYLFFVF
jgi:hypothetical protein